MSTTYLLWQTLPELKWLAIRIFHEGVYNPIYSLSRKTVNTRENVWNVDCFTTNQMRDETAKGNRQTAAGISHDLQDLIRNNQLVHSSTRNLQFSLCITLKSHFYHKLTLATWYRLFKNQTTELTQSGIDRANCESLQRYRFASWVKVSQLQKNSDRKPPITAK